MGCFTMLLLGEHILAFLTTSLLIAISICLSTLTVKQHVIVDVLVGIMLAELSYYIAGQCGRIRMLNGNIGSFDR